MLNSDGTAPAVFARSQPIVGAPLQSCFIKKPHPKVPCNHVSSVGEGDIFDRVSNRSRSVSCTASITRVCNRSAGLMSLVGQGLPLRLRQASRPAYPG